MTFEQPLPSPGNTHRPRLSVAALADQCVKCGLCLPRCPTYRQSSSESESPRGRIALIQALAEERLTASPATLEHLDACLGCMNCEKVCPAQVDYSELLDTGRQLSAARSGKLRVSAAARAITRPALNRVLQILIQIYQRSGTQWLLRRLKLLPARLRRLDAMLPNSHPAVRSLSSADAPKQPIFVGCTGQLFDRYTLDATQTLVRKLGLQPELITTPACCGAIHGHGGDPSHGQALAAQVHAQAREHRPVLSIATGCSAYLQEQADHAGSVQDVGRWMASALANSTLRALPQRWGWHSPCSERNILRSDTDMRTALEHIPDLQLVAIGPSSGCCGAAGSHLLDRPDQADALVRHYVEQVEGAALDGVLSSNIGCSLHLRQALRARGLDIPVLHPVRLLADQLD